MKTGWICPKCQKVYSPHVDECAACNCFAWKPYQPPVSPTVVPPNTLRPWRWTGAVSTKPIISSGSVSVEVDPNILSWN